MFIRVRSSRPGAALHEFDVPIVTYERHPDLYKIVNKKPVAKQRPASHISGVVAEPTPARKTPTRGRRAKPRKAAPKTGEEPIAPSAGLTPEEENE